MNVLDRSCNFTVFQLLVVLFKDSSNMLKFLLVSGLGSGIRSEEAGHIITFGTK